MSQGISLLEAVGLIMQRLELWFFDFFTTGC